MTRKNKGLQRENGVSGINTSAARKNAPERRKSLRNQLFRGEYVTCDRIGLKGKVLTLDCEVRLGKHAWAWKATYLDVWTDKHGVRHVTRGIAIVREWECQMVAELEAA